MIDGNASVDASGTLLTPVKFAQIVSTVDGNHVSALPAVVCTFGLV